MADGATYSAVWHGQLAEIPQADWDALAQPLASPFLEWAWLNALEASGSVAPQWGWQPCHLTLWRDRALVAAAPLYLKSHSYGEFIFDHQWAALTRRLGVRYYPKLLGMAPFTPAISYRFLTAADEDEGTLVARLVAEIDRFCHERGIAGCHLLFVEPQWRHWLEQNGFCSWLHHSYVWQNQNFGSFEDYLQAFNANQRRNIKRERKAVAKAGLRTEVLAGEDIPAWLFPEIYRFYSDTCERFFAISKYLTRAFFEQLYPDFRHRVVLALAYPQGEADYPVGLSFCVRKGDRLYGRYWGCLQDYDALHFEACYYKPLEWAIAQSIQSFDPGAGGTHKMRRGFPATPNYSLHRFYDARMSQILHAYIDDINAMEREEIAAINQDLPLKSVPADVLS